jgi:biopolymer transport protein ExbD/biopolymer transport protein TolR
VVAWRERVRRGVQPDMNVTPLVDVVLVLLIIFMVVAPQLQRDIPVELPGIFNPDPDVEANVDAIKVTVNTPGQFHVDEDQYDLDGVIQFLSDQHQRDPLRRLVLRGDSHLKYGQIREFMARTQQIGFPGLNFMVGEKARDGERATADYAGRQEAGAPETGAPDAGAPAPADAAGGDQAAPAAADPAAPETPPADAGAGS